LNERKLEANSGYNGPRQSIVTQYMLSDLPFLTDTLANYSL